MVAEEELVYGGSPHKPVYVLIVQKVVESATLMDTALVGEDTDLLILLCYHASLIQAQNIF